MGKNENTDGSTRQALALLKKHLPLLEPFDGKKIKTLNNFFELDNYGIKTVLMDFLRKARKPKGGLLIKTILNTISNQHSVQFLQWSYQKQHTTTVVVRLKFRDLGFHFF